jgi:hypothetical protein
MTKEQMEEHLEMLLRSRSEAWDRIEKSNLSEQESLETLQCILDCIIQERELLGLTPPSTSFSQEQS